MDVDRPITSPPDGPCLMLACDGSDVAIAAETWLASVHWKRPPLIDVVTVAHRGITRLGWTVEGSREGLHRAIDRIREGEMLAAQRIANEAGERLQEQGFTVRTWARSGDVVEELLAMAAEIRPSLVVVGPRGRSGLVEALLGSVTIQVVDQCAMPVLVARDQPTLLRGSRPAHIALLVDSEPGAREAITRLNELGWLEADRLTFIGLTGVAPGLAGDDMRLAEEVGDLIQRDVVVILEQLATELPEGATSPDLEVLSGDPRRAALDVIARLGADLAVVVRPPHRRGIDPYTTKIARHAPASVMVVPA